MKTEKSHIVTGAFGYSGKYIAQRLLKKGFQVGTLTNSSYKTNPFGNEIEVYPLAFDDTKQLADSLKNTDVLYNTYWVRFNHKKFTQSVAVENTLRLFEAAKEAGVKRIVHVSITNPDENSHLEYFSGKAKLEKALINSGISYAILRPAVLFGREDILINNMAWMIRKFPFFGVFGKGEYRLQPVFVDDLAKLAVEYGEKRENVIIDAIGPETFTYKDLVRSLMRILGKHKPVISVPPWLGYLGGRIMGAFTGDVVITKPEIKGLMTNLLYTESMPSCETKLTDWAEENKNILGVKYASELGRRK